MERPRANSPRRRGEPARPRVGRLRLRAAVVLAAALAFAPALRGAEEPPCGIEPPAKPKRIKGGEGVPPLPLPATPLRRSERKRDPAPPTLVGKVRWGRRDLVWKLPDGQEKHYGDWSLDPNDIHRLLEAVTREIKTKYGPREMDLAGFSFDPEEVPILYATGLRPFSLTDAERGLLREYLVRGGTFLAVAHHGSKEFSDSVRREAALVLPGRPMRLLPPDHPVYRSHRRIDRVTYTPGTKDRPEGAPYLEGISLGCRAALILSPYDLCCAWDSDHLPDDQPGVRGEDAFALGLDIIAYAIACWPLGRYYGRFGLVEMEDREVDRGDFLFAEVRHSGDYDPHPNAYAGLLAEAVKTTTIGARFRRKVLPLSSPELASHPFLYMTGHGDFRLSAEERAGLHRYLSSGGFLLADACCGDLTFDLAFRREISAALPESRLEPLEPEHPIFTSVEPVREVEYSTAVRASFPDLKAPCLEGAEAGGSLCVVYSRFGLGTAWDGEDRPFAMTVRPDDARRLGVNIIVYAMTH